MTAATIAPSRTRLSSADPTAADLAFASGNTVLLARWGAPIDLPTLDEGGPERLSQLALRSTNGDPNAIVAGLIPFDPARPPELFVAEQTLRAPAPDRRRGSAPGVVGQGPTHTVGGDRGFRSAVRRALQQISAGELTKVVLARHWDLTGSDDAINLDQVWDRLAAGNPHGYTFAVRRPGETFLGASPELVAQVDATGFATHPLAGSATRTGDPSRDRQAGAALLKSDKDLREHRHVVDHIVNRLSPLVTRLDVPATPAIFATDAMLHLGTRLTGTLQPEVNALHAALAIHPTPAVCGVPVNAALPAIHRLESTDRGFYAGLVGWMDGLGHGQWAYALRCATVSGPTARLFAGAGIVAGSTPQAEEAETTAKFVTAATALRSPQRMMASA